jgi:hypothetical protein
MDDSRRGGSGICPSPLLDISVNKNLRAEGNITNISNKH